MAQSVSSLPCKYRDLSSISRTHVLKKKMQAYVSNPSTEETQAQGSLRFAKLVSPEEKFKSPSQKSSGATIMAWWLRALTTLLEKPSLIWSTHMKAHNHQQFQDPEDLRSSIVFSQDTADTWYAYIQAGKTPKYMQNNKKCKCKTNKNWSQELVRKTRKGKLWPPLCKHTCAHTCTYIHKHIQSENGSDCVTSRQELLLSLGFTHCPFPWLQLGFMGWNVSING